MVCVIDLLQQVLFDWVPYDISTARSHILLNHMLV